MTQTKLTEREIQKLIERKDSLEWMMKSIADQLETASRAVAEVNNRIEQMVRYKTSDGKPYIEPEPPIPEGWRKALDNEHCRKDVKLWDKDKKQWAKRLFPSQPFLNGDRYIVPIDQPLTDEDACVWPRLKVMVRDDESQPWRGPAEFHGICPGSGFPFSYMGINDKLRGIAVYARRATPEEIEAAK